MDIGVAFTLKSVGTITGSSIVERPKPDGPSVWVIKFETSQKLPAYMSNLLEVARGNPKIFKGAQAALNDLRSIGIMNTNVQLTDISSFRANRFEWLYPWIRGMAEQGYDENRILNAFSVFNGTKLDLNNDNDVRLTRIIIQHALGQSDGKELEAYLPPVDVLDVRILKQIDDEGWFLCQAHCSNSDEDFTFLVSEVEEKKLRLLFTNHKAALCKLALFAAHQRNPWEYTDASVPQLTPGTHKTLVARFKLNAEDILAISGTEPSAETMV